ncbi:LysR family transcriptional regulator [Allokutzneria sp. NRRL B-24872]|uniref:LysR family transcriptional regulator n=1 Tax=Allokutzneria sp. NRRL B-24872 TaxID=1137961 RepID=UPI000A3A6BDF|nr:LysR family transcriptional regulator [Allokutzneria sp. NRRL B-24872]
MSETGGVMDLDVRLLRHFVAAAEELHFTRAAARVCLTQQALSRDIARLEMALGKPLFARSTRRVSLTSDGELLLRLARPLLAHHDEVVGQLRSSSRFVVDVVGEFTTAARLLATARRDEDDFEFYARETPGLAISLAQLRDHHIDAAFCCLPDTFTLPAGVEHRRFHTEPLGLLVPRGHPLARRRTIPMSVLPGLEICCHAGNHVTGEWDRFAAELLAKWGAVPVADHPVVRGAQDLAHHVRPGEPPVLVPVGQPEIPGTVLRPLAGTEDGYPWGVVWRTGTQHAGLDALHRAIDEV